MTDVLVRIMWDMESSTVLGLLVRAVYRIYIKQMVVIDLPSSNQKMSVHSLSSSCTEKPALPILWRLRSGVPYITFMVTFGLLVDLTSYGIIVPVLPFRLAETGHTDIATQSSYRRSSPDDLSSVHHITQSD